MARVSAHEFLDAMLAWIDIDNPPQVQYMAPFVERSSGGGWTSS